MRAAWEYAGPLDTFVHRPMANRLAMAGLDALAAGPTPLREKIMVGCAIVAVAGAAATLQLSLLRRTDPIMATAVSLGVFASLSWVSEAYVLQPEWTATVLAVGALGLALLALSPSPHRWLPPLLFGAAGVLLAIAVLQKYTTVSAALLALFVVAVVDRRRGLLLAMLSGTLTVALLGLTFAVGRYEWQWFTETSRLNPTSGLRLDAFGEWAVNWAWNNPVLLAWPAAAALAARLTGRRVWAWGSALGYVVVLAVIVLQNQFFGYHGTPLLPVAAAVVVFAAVRWTQRSGTLLLGLLPLAGWVGISRAVYPAPIAWRFDYRFAMAGWLLVVIVVVAGLVWLQARRPRVESSRVFASNSTQRAVTGVLLAVALTFPGWPATPYGFFGQDRSRRSEVERQTELLADGAAVRAAVNEASVAYLADGETVYVVGNPTPCAYPGAVVLYRSNVAGVSDLRSFTDNLACLDDEAAEFLVLQTWRVPFDELDPRVGEAVARNFDCDPGIAVRELLICPRRS